MFDPRSAPALELKAGLGKCVASVPLPVVPTQGAIPEEGGTKKINALLLFLCISYFLHTFLVTWVTYFRLVNLKMTVIRHLQLIGSIKERKICLLISNRILLHNCIVQKCNTYCKILSLYQS